MVEWEIRIRIDGVKASRRHPRLAWLFTLHTLKTWAAGTSPAMKERVLRSGKKLLGDQCTELVVFNDEFADELVQAALKNAVHAAVLQAGPNAARLPLSRPLAARGAGNLMQAASDHPV